jgi:DUF4097 and DUF4098 domain-containing protein YvlB
MSGIEPTPDDVPLHPGSLEGIARIRIDCEETDLSLEADAALVGVVHLVTGGGSNVPTLIREGDELILFQRGRHRGANRAPTLLVPEQGCPAISGSLEKGDLNVERVSTALALRQGAGDVRLVGGSGDVALDLGKGDLTASNRAGQVAVRAGAGDVRLSRCRGAAALSLGKGDVQLDTLEGDLDIRTGSGDISAADCAGALTIKSGSGDVLVNRPRGLLLTATNGNGDVSIRGGSLTGLKIRNGRGDIVSSAQLLYIPSEPAAGPQDLPPTGGPEDVNPVARLLRDKGIEFMAGDQGVRFSRGPFHFEASDAGVRIAKGSFAFEASDKGVRVVTNGGDGALGAFSAETSAGDIVIDVPANLPLRVEALVSGGDVRSDVPLVSVGRPGPRGSTQRYIGVTDPNASDRLNLRVKTDRGDIRIRMVAGLPTPPRPPAPPPPPERPAPRHDPFATTNAIAMPPPAPPDREARMRAVLDALARGEISVNEADRRLKELEEES